jgi:hypothetical protein
MYQQFSKLTREEWARIFGAESYLSLIDEKLVASADAGFRRLEGAEREAMFLRIAKTLESPLEVAGNHRKERWIKGWQETLDGFIASNYSLDALRPQFVRRKEVMRFGQDYVLPETDSLETSWVALLRSYLFSRYFQNLENVFEFGAGTGHNLAALGRQFPHLKLVGLDWVEPAVRIYECLREKNGLNIKGSLFDLSTPDKDVVLPARTGVLTIGALEQLGNRFGPFLEYLISQGPEVVVHVETIHELYDQNTLFDWVAARYLEKRGYLNGYLTALKEQEARGRIKILEVRRTFGGLCHDGYTFIVWKPTGK